jgi:uncharacterized membrane-anchored protein
MNVQAVPTPQFADHPLRARVLAEVHARPFVPVSAPKRILHFAFMTDFAASGRARDALNEFCRARGLSGPQPGAKHHRVELSPAVLRWEHHGEFTTYTWEFAESAEAEPFRPTPDERASLQRLLPQPGPLLVAVDLHILPEATVGDGYTHLFGPSQLAVSQVEGGKALIATDFHPDAFGVVRLLVMDRGLSAPQAGALVQRLLEIETYRTLALLGLPQAQELGPSIRRIETELPELMREMRQSEGFDTNRRLLDRLTELAAELEVGAAESLFRFGATRAYDELLQGRLRTIGEQPVIGLPTWAVFLDRRLGPAIKTCASTEERQANLSRKLSRAAQLLRTRVDIELESQNSGLLRRMNERAHLQLQLQQTVEGLSVAAISYYISSLLHHIFDGVYEALHWPDPTIATAVSVPFVVALVAFNVHRIRIRHFGDKH